MVKEPNTQSLRKRQRPRSGLRRGPQRIWLRHRRFVRSFCCCVPGCRAQQTELAHIRTAANAGTGLKPHDAHAVPLCRNHHREQHDCGAETFQDRHGIDLEAVAAELVRRSPDAVMRASLRVAA